MWLQTLGWAMMALIDRLIIKYFDVRPANVAAGILLYWIGSNYVWYYVREPFMVHIASAFWVVATITLILQVIDSAENGERYAKWMALLGFAFGMALICRPTDLFIVPFFLWALLRIYRIGQLRRFVLNVPAAFTIWIPVGIQMILWQKMSGSPLYYSYDKEGFYFLRPALWQTLFHVSHGLFLWTPMYIVSVVGIIWWIRRANYRIEPILGCLILSGLLLWYINSSWWCWWFGWAFGGRAWIELAPLFVIGLVFALTALRTASKNVRTTAFALVAACLIFNLALAAAYQLNLIPRAPKTPLRSSAPI
jgi:hypothetical protein